MSDSGFLGSRHGIIALRVVLMRLFADEAESKDSTKPWIRVGEKVGFSEREIIGLVSGIRKLTPKDASKIAAAAGIELFDLMVDLGNTAATILLSEANQDLRSFKGSERSDLDVYEDLASHGNPSS